MVLGPLGPPAPQHPTHTPWDGVRTAQPKRHELLNRVGKTNFAGELYQADGASEWGDGFGGAATMNLARGEKGVNIGF
jgi:hypothetical protein